ncbi:ABC transporter ATP-binding protein [Roseospira marina]|uniref:ABC transporter ATP-binding protein n=1 Tax=Roseospira marina TaxID=140057 RepID=A0A5M6IDZ1_9PROT|nr:ABC transporter ATP-binding protein [Roseospira marina]KAA5606504.1 ABC transporter ATP-binding protein [Roseospira marina]MBB4314073.1 peptide/nickel transport system ATP-binding protein [Roseospira marina]MBB5087234.1 peptide/nickel transport system ATP-binding protein [Roseospira marina]
MPLLDVRDLRVEFPTRHGVLTALHDVSFSVDKGERLGIVGESGAGKSVAAFAILNLLSRPGRITGGRILFEDRDLATLSRADMRAIRGDRISMIFQDPMMTLNPVLTIGTQMVETLKAHRDISDAEARRIAIQRLGEVKIPSPEKRMASYPHELSGGMRQRVVIAIALLTEPALIIADEPTTALDVTIQAEIMSLMLDLCRTHGVGLILITHDLAVVSQVTQRVVVLYAGRVVESGQTARVVQNPVHPYTRGLLSALPGEGEPGARLNQIRGSMPPLTAIPPGCAFHPRCDYAEERCRVGVPPLDVIEDHNVRCTRARELIRGVAA